MDSKTSSDMDEIPEKGVSSASDKALKEQDNYENLNYPEPWKFESGSLAGVAIMFYGYDQGECRNNLNPHYQELMGIAPIEGNSRNVAALGGIVSVYYGGTLIGALIAGSLADRMGRIKAVVFGCLWALLGAVFQASAYNITWICFGQVISGVGV
ncbi:MAG: hypothetical protein Q9204_003672 [Flavoplaca sp. TL-2023a]